MKSKLFFLGAMILLLTSCSGSGPADTVKKFHSRLEAGELEAALELLSSSTRSQISDDKMKQGLQQATRDIDSKGGIKKIEIVEEKVIGETAEVKVKVIFGNGSEDTDQNSLIKEDGKWRIQPGRSQGK